MWIANNTTMTDLVNILTNVSFTLTVGHEADAAGTSVVPAGRRRAP